MSTQLPSKETLAQDAARRDAKAGRCRFNCRNEKENWTAGYAKCLLDIGGWTEKGSNEEAEREWKRQQKKEG